MSKNKNDPVAAAVQRRPPRRGGGLYGACPDLSNPFFKLSVILSKKEALDLNLL
jgi:hypothetical protein